MDYAGSVAALRIVQPLLVAQCEFGKMNYDANKQRAINMRLAGIQ